MPMVPSSGHSLHERAEDDGAVVSAKRPRDLFGGSSSPGAVKNASGCSVTARRRMARNAAASPGEGTDSMVGSPSATVQHGARVYSRVRDAWAPIALPAGERLTMKKRTDRFVAIAILAAGGFEQVELTIPRTELRASRSQGRGGVAAERQDFRGMTCTSRSADPRATHAG